MLKLSFKPDKKKLKLIEKAFGAAKGKKSFKRDTADRLERY